MNAGKRYSIYDIAKELELAPSTISKALSDSPTISEKTKERVRSFIKDRGYSPNVAASSLKSKVSMSIGLAYPVHFAKVMGHFFFAQVAEYFRDYIEKRGYEFSFVTNHIGNYRMSYANFCQRRNLDGVLILAATSADDDVAEIADTGIKCVSIDQISEKIPFVQTNGMQGAELIVNHILELGKKRVAYIAAPLHMGEFKKRMDLFIEAFSKSGHTLDPQYLYVGEGVFVKDGMVSSLDFLAKLKKENREIPDLIVVSNDELAMGVIRGLEEKGYRVPEDIGVIGFDDMYFAKYYTPALTTVKQDCKAIGITAAKLLLDLIAEEENIQKANYVDCQLKVRDSTVK